VRYHLEIKPEVREYLSHLPLLSREGRIKLAVGMIALSDVPDQFRADSGNRLGPGSRYFRLQYTFTDNDKVRILTLIADDSAAAYGVLVVEYADCI
jgi:hypothetical protein